ncbi:MAG: TIGR04338 family metallohydrolase [Actinomycetes bacterium]
MNTRDTDRSAVYATEDLWCRSVERATSADGTITTTIAGSRVVLSAERRFASVQSVATFIDTVTGMPGFANRWPDIPPVEVRQRKGISKAHWQGGTIAIPDTPTYLREEVVLHELAHHVVAHTHPTVPAHGGEFRAALCQLLSLTLGEEAGWSLSVLFAQADLPVAYPVAERV